VPQEVPCWETVAVEMPQCGHLLQARFHDAGALRACPENCTTRVEVRTPYTIAYACVAVLVVLLLSRASDIAKCALAEVCTWTER
jgi:hypothetical protein